MIFYTCDKDLEVLENTDPHDAMAEHLEQLACMGEPAPETLTIYKFEFVKPDPKIVIKDLIEQLEENYNDRYWTEYGENEFNPTPDLRKKALEFSKEFLKGYTCRMVEKTGEFEARVVYKNGEFDTWEPTDIKCKNYIHFDKIEYELYKRTSCEIIRDEPCRYEPVDRNYAGRIDMRGIWQNEN